jgi:ParB/RepB/Spo0J family partition protein
VTRARAKSNNSSSSRRRKPRIQQLPIEMIRPERGLGRKRDRQGHQELCRSIERFGVLSPITVRSADDGSEEFLLVKGQGRTLACRQLGLATIPAFVMEGDFSETEKVQQFLVENVARLRMKPVDRALLIAHARAAGEETEKVAERFGISASTVRRLETQLDGASDAEIAALRRGDVTLATQSVIARLVTNGDRTEVIEAISGLRVASADLQTVLLALGWAKLVELGRAHRASRISLLRWACSRLASGPRGSSKTRIIQLSKELPTELPRETTLQEWSV